MIDKLRLPFSLLSDAEGTVIREYGLWNEEEEVSRPAILVLDPDGVVGYAYEGRDFADRPGDEPVLVALGTGRDGAGGDAA
jgi:peroxiredoxin